MERRGGGFERDESWRKKREDVVSPKLNLGEEEGREWCRYLRRCNEGVVGAIKPKGDGFLKEVFLSNTLINLYIKLGDLGCARLVFDEMSERNVMSWAFLVSGYVHNEFDEEAFVVFRRIIREGFVPNSYAIGSILRVCYKLEGRGVGLGLQVHGLVLKMVYAFDVVICNVLIFLYGGYMEYPDSAFHIFGEICVKNLVSCN
ncbi:hypothetical protein AgCh_034654 [Apium graveolens]